VQLLKLVESEVLIGAPLPWNVRNQDCTLLLARGYWIGAFLWTWKRFAPWKHSSPRFYAPRQHLRSLDGRH